MTNYLAILMALSADDLKGFLEKVGGASLYHRCADSVFLGYKHCITDNV